MNTCERCNVYTRNDNRKGHQKTIPSKDANARNTFEMIDMDGNTISGFSTI